MAVKTEIFETVQRTMNGKDKALSRSCFGWALETCKEIERTTERRCILQAGSAYWPLCPVSEDDGVRPLRYGYEWQPLTRPAAQIAKTVLTGILPEIHVWAALPDRMEIVDFTTGLWPEAAKQNLGLEWLAPHKPPRFFWGTADDLKALGENAEYRPAWDAIKFIRALAWTVGELA